MDDGGDRAGVDDDHPGARAVLLRHGAQEERAGDHGAEPWHGIIIGGIAGGICYWACTWLKQRFNYDDSLDVFGVHGVGGLTGTLLCGVFATAAIGGTAGLIEGHPQQLLIQLYGVAVTLVWSAGVTYGLLKLVGVFVPLRVSKEHEMEGLDISQHGEALQ